MLKSATFGAKENIYSLLLGKAAISRANRNSQGVTDMGQQWSKGWAQKKDMKPKWPQTQEQQPDSSGKMLPEAATQPLLSQNWSAGVFPTTHPPPSPPSRTQPPRAHK